MGRLIFIKAIIEIILLYHYKTILYSHLFSKHFSLPLAKANGYNG